jgi:hypothetical protein
MLTPEQSDQCRRFGVSEFAPRRERRGMFYFRRIALAIDTSISGHKFQPTDTASHNNGGSIFFQFMV